MILVAFALPGIFSRRGSTRLRITYPHDVIVFASVGTEQANALRAVAAKRKLFRTPQGLLVVLASTCIDVWNSRGTRLLIHIETDRARYEVGEYTTLGRSYPALIVDIVRCSAIGSQNTVTVGRLPTGRATLIGGL
ncbi:MAG: hypothetical protein J0I43_09760 [Microbacterium sp.]|uniref:hypothetical protein n=1 Tax=Microbacterium sp. TaxID=51671 RepID=UPI001AC4309B|nr:hypothetical protein [Microbacterium sp.]MBN9177637.1 hypothetical protein [Microbacterium sp.]